MLHTVPVEPDADQARNWLLDELAKPEYQAARPSWFDELAAGFFRWLDSLFRPTGTPADAIAPILAVLVIAGLIVAAFFLFGRPRLRRVDRRRVGSVFGTEDPRTAAELRASAARAHRAGDDTVAIEELFRALARRQDERALVTATPAMTAQEFSARASAVFPSAQEGLRAAAAGFDRVRYLGGSGTADAYAELDLLVSALWDRRAEATAIPELLGSSS